MTITIQLSPQIENVLVTRAHEHGMSVDAYVKSVLENTANKGSMLSMSAEEFEAALNELSEGSENMPILPPGADSRESIYGNG